MTTNYNEIRAKMSPERRQRIDERVQETMREMAEEQDNVDIDKLLLIMEESTRKLALLKKP